MRKIFACLFCGMFVWSAAAQENRTEPYLPPMENYKSQFSAQQQNRAPILKARGLNIDDGYGILSPYGVAALFGGTPAYEDYAAAVRYGRIGAYLLWPGVSLSATGLIITLYAATRVDPHFDFWELGGGAGLGLFIVGIPMIAAGASFTVKAKSRIARAVDIYNEYTRSSYNPAAPEFSFGFTPGGIGLALRF